MRKKKNNNIRTTETTEQGWQGIVKYYLLKETNRILNK